MHACTRSANKHNACTVQLEPFSFIKRVVNWEGIKVPEQCKINVRARLLFLRSANENKMNVLGLI